MVRLLKDFATPEPDPEDTRLLPERIRDAFQGLGVAMLRLSAEADRAMQSLRAAMDPLYRAGRAKDWADQFPVYTCGYVFGDAPCDRTWDRRRVTAPELRALVWDHIQADHVSGQRGQQIADQIVSRIMDRP